MSILPTNDELVVVVNTYDEPIGLMNKRQAHVDGELHRAFSAFVFNDDGEFLLQRRALGKYHSGGLWSNTCCSHPRPGEHVLDAAHRRLDEEMGFGCQLEPAFAFVYKAALGKGLIEHEFDHVLIGYSNAIPIINENEVSEYRYTSLDVIRKELERAENTFTVWFRLCFERVAILVEDRRMRRTAA